MPRQMTYSKPITGLRKTQLMRLALDLNLPSDGTVLDLRNRIGIVLTAQKDNLSRDPRFTKLYPRRHQNPAGSPRNSQPSSRSVSPTLSDSLSWHGIQLEEPEVQDFNPLPATRSTSPASVLAHDNHQGTGIRQSTRYGTYGSFTTIITRCGVKINYYVNFVQPSRPINYYYACHHPVR